ncbi:MAG: hypothetical protein ACLR17_01885 [Enterobacteriaceae bacterium]
MRRNAFNGFWKRVQFIGFQSVFKSDDRGYDESDAFGVFLYAVRMSALPLTAGMAATAGMGILGWGQWL